MEIERGFYYLMVSLFFKKLTHSTSPIVQRHQLEALWVQVAENPAQNTYTVRNGISSPDKEVWGKSSSTQFKQLSGLLNNMGFFFPIFPLCQPQPVSPHVCNITA